MAHPLSLPQSGVHRRGYHLVEVTSELIRPEAHACTPVILATPKSIRHQSCGVLGGWIQCNLHPQRCGVGPLR